MRPNQSFLLIGMFTAALMAASSSARAQVQTTGTPGSPSATTTVDGKQLPPPDPKFGGVINPSAVDSKPFGRRPSFRPGGRPTCS